MVNKIIVSILGMHRSGTSCVTGMLEEQGVFLSNVNECAMNNPKGNRENHRIVDLNDDLLQYNKATWFSPPKKKIRFNGFYRKWQKHVLEEFCFRPIAGFKDPRTLLLLDFWEDTIQPIGVIRNPISVAASLFHRSQMPFSTCIALWKHYNQILLAFRRSRIFPVIDFDCKETLETQVTRALDFYGLVGALKPYSFYDPALCPHDSRDWDNDGIDSGVSRIYQELSGYSKQLD